MAFLFSTLSRVRGSATKMSVPITLGFAIGFACALPANADDRAVVAKIKPIYPEMAKRLKILGTVMMNATVEPDGTVKAVKTVMGERLLLEAAKDAVMKWKFAPAEHETIEDVEIEFK